MADAVLSVSFAGPLVTVQDGGRPGHMRFGVAASGPMDDLSFAAANAALGNPDGHAGIEVSLGGLMLTCRSGAVTIAITGGDFVVEHRGHRSRSWTVLTLQEGDKLAVRAGSAGSWAYLAFAGALQANQWLGGKATHAPSGFGGGAIRGGQILQVADAVVLEDRLGDIRQPDFAEEGPIRVVMGPQDDRFLPSATDRFLKGTFTVTDGYDRMGMRLDGPMLELDGALSIPSEPIARGSIQVSGDGVPTVLLADHQTTGGYPKIATVVSSDIGRLTQLRSGKSLRFTAVEPDTTIALARSWAQQTRGYLKDIAVPRGTLAQRLMRENLIHGMIEDDGL